MSKTRNLMEITVKDNIALLSLNKEILSEEGTYMLNKWDIIFNETQKMKFDFLGNIPNLSFVIDYKLGVYTLRRYSNYKILFSSSTLEEFEEQLQTFFINEKYV